MATVAALSALTLFAVFAAAGLAKLADLGGSRSAVEGFGVPVSLARPIGTALPVVELLVAALLVFPATAVAGAVGAGLVLLAFTAAIALNVARGRTPDCHCFGQLHSAPAGWGTLARNVALLVIAGTAAVSLSTEQGTSAFSWIGDVDGSTLPWFAAAAGFGLAALGGWLLLRTLRRHGTLLLRIEQLERTLLNAGLTVPPDPGSAGLPVGKRAPGFELPNVSGGMDSLDRLVAAGDPLLLIFTDSGCAPCHDLLPEIAAWQQEAEAPAIAVAASGPGADVGRTAAEHELGHVLLDEDGRLFEAFDVPATPGAVLIDPDGKIASPAVAGPDQIAALLAATRPRGRGGRGPAIGSDAPRVELELVGGGTTEIGSGAAGERLLIFWNPECGFCREMYDELLDLERRTDREIMIVSGGDEAGTRAEGFRSPVALDPDLEAASAYGATGTPMALVIDGDGRIVSPLAAGRDDVLALAGAVGTGA